MQKLTRSRGVWLTAICLVCLTVGQAAEPTVQSTVDGIISRMVGSLSPEELFRLNEDSIQRFITPGDRGVLATQYWHFEANVPVVLSVMRDVKQTEMSFWLPAAGFRKTGLKVANEEYEYEVRQVTRSCDLEGKVRDELVVEK